MERRFSSKALVIIVLTFSVLLGAAYFAFLRRPSVQEPVITPPVSKVQREVIGKSVEGREILAYTYGNGPTHLLFVGGVHGGYEWNSSLLAYQFMEYLEAYPDRIPTQEAITVIPALNPDGLYKVVKKEGQFALSDAPREQDASGLGRFNAHEVDLNRNFDCKWQPTSTWRSKTVSAGTKAFSEPEAQALESFVMKHKPTAAVFWHSQANAVYASACESGILPETLVIMNAYAKAAGYSAVQSFDAYPVSGDAEGWLASINIPAITVELKTHETVEWEKNLAGIEALLTHYSR